MGLKGQIFFGALELRSGFSAKKLLQKVPVTPFWPWGSIFIFQFPGFASSIRRALKEGSSGALGGAKRRDDPGFLAAFCTVETLTGFP